MNKLYNEMQAEAIAGSSIVLDVDAEGDSLRCDIAPHNEPEKRFERITAVKTETGFSVTIPSNVTKRMAGVYNLDFVLSVGDEETVGARIELSVKRSAV